MCHVNIIPLNPTGGYAGKPAEYGVTINRLHRHIWMSYGVSATVRVRRGIDIDAGCGQLKSNVINPKHIPTS